MPEGTYVLNQALGALVIDDDVTIVGAGADLTMLEMTPPAERGSDHPLDPHVLDIAEPSGGLTPNVTIRGLEIAGGTTNLGGWRNGGDIRNARS